MKAGPKPKKRIMGYSAELLRVILTYVNIKPQ
jgi:hypothetical protein